MKIVIFILRIVVGLVFILSGSEKLLQPSENFLYVIRGYDVLPFAALENLVALIFPWVELILGCFLVLGLWLRVTLLGVWLCLMTFLSIVGQAIFRDLAISECGCFGDLVKLPLPTIMTFDSILFLITSFLFFAMTKTRAWSLDQHFQRSK
jgi:putative oxidoreductase